MSSEVAVESSGLTSVCVIIVNWNSGDLLQRCLASVESQTLQPRRVLVFDNASVDGSLERARAGFPRVEFIASAENAGFARANNLCVQRCTDCDWIFLLNPDAFPAPDCLENLLAEARKAPDLDCFAPLILQEQAPDKIDSAGDCYRLSGIALHRLHGLPRTMAGEATEVFSPCAAAALYRRAAFVECGGFDESYFAYYEDVDLGFRMQLRGFRTMFTPGAVVHHVGGGTTGGGGNVHSVFHGQRNFIVTWFKDMPAALFWPGLPLHLWAILKGLARGVRYGQGILMLRATWLAFMSLPRYLAARQSVQSQRRISAASLKRVMAA